MGTCLTEIRAQDYIFSHYFDHAVPAGDVPSFTPAPIVENYFATLMQLDDLAAPGVSEDVFQQLFVKCRHCRTYMTTRTTLFHECKGPGPTDNVVVIDLTNED